MQGVRNHAVVPVGDNPVRVCVASHGSPSPQHLLDVAFGLQWNLSFDLLNIHFANLPAAAIDYLAAPRPPALIDAYMRPEDGRRARTYRFVYRSSVLALSRMAALELNARVCDALQRSGCFETRTPDALSAARDEGEAEGEAEGEGDGNDERQQQQPPGE